MQSPDGHENSLSPQPATYRDLYAIGLGSLHSAGQAVAQKAEEAQALSQAEMEKRAQRGILAPLHNRLRELALQEMFKETKELLHKNY